MRIRVNDIDMNYELGGKKDAPLVVLSHSLGSSLAMWSPQLTVLESRYQVLRYDMRGHGDSDATQGAYSLEQLGEDVVGLLDAVNISRVHFVGLSIGGMIGQAIALNHAERLRSLVLCDTSAYLPPAALPIVQERIETVRSQGLQALVDGTLERWFTASYLKQNPPLVALVRKQFLATSAAGYIGCSQAIGKLSFLERLPQIRHPTLIMVGAEDPGTPVAASEAIHERIQGSQLIVLPSASHLSNIEQAEKFNSHLLAFLEAQ